jgi:hypothetical protein
MAAEGPGEDGGIDLRRLHGRFVAGEIDAGSLRAADLRDMVAASWQRSRATGVDPDGDPPAAPGGLTERDRHPLAPLMPTVRRLLVDDAAESGVMVAVGSADGTLLWVEGDATVRRNAERMHFEPGAVWREDQVGTNAPGTALALDREVQIRGSEHFARAAQRFSCTAVPIHDPTTRSPIGVLDVTGSPDLVGPHTLALVRAAALAVEGQLAVQRLAIARPPEPAAAPAALVRVLGTEKPRWVTTTPDGDLRTVPLSGRHAEILVLLARHPEGLSADHLALLLGEGDLDVVTVRAEMSRLRKVVGAAHLGSRPYRLILPVLVDAEQVVDAVRAGDLRRALGDYPGPLLPNSLAPGIARLRTELTESMRSAVLASRDLTVLRRWLDSPEGRDDHAGWRVLRRHGDPASRAEAAGRLAALDLDLG